MNHFKDGIDFIVVSYYRVEYIKLLVRSIEKYTDYPYLVTIVANEKTDSDEYRDLVDTYREVESVDIVDGTGQESFEDRGGIEGVVWKRDELGNKIGPGSINHGKGLTIGMKNTNKKYICFLDNDVVFLNKWVEDILPMLEDNFFISNRFDKGIAREMFMIFKRKEFAKYELYPDASYVDNCGNITKFSNENDLKFMILDNSCFDSSGFHRNKKEHLLDLPHGEQVYVNNVPFFYHYGRGSSRDDNLYGTWTREVTKYLEKK